MSGRVSFAVTTTQSPDPRALHSMRRPVRAARAGAAAPAEGGNGWLMRDEQARRASRGAARLRVGDSAAAGTSPHPLTERSNRQALAPPVALHG